MRKFTISEIVYVLFLAYFLPYIWTEEISLETQSIPTVVNGVTASLSLVVGFTGATIALALSNQFIKPGEDKFRVWLTLGVIGLSIGLLWSAFFSIIFFGYDTALRTAMTGLAISVAIFLDFMGYLSLKM